MLSFASYGSLLFAFLLVPILSLSSINPASKSPSDSTHRHVTQQDHDNHPPFPILEIGLQHILAQIGANATEAGNESMSGTTHHHINPSQKLPTQLVEAVDQCGPGAPCVDGSCCNSEGKCGFTPYNCGPTATTSCISNCDSRAMCGVNSRNSAEKCPLNLCCSYFGYCGDTEVHCGNPNGMAPCQSGYGSCQIAAIPSCNGGTSASGGRRVAYYQAGNLLYRKCNRICPSDIVPRDLTHLIFAFVFINPNTFKVESENDPDDHALYYQFTALKTTTTQTWLSIGGYGFSDPGETFTTWSVLCADQARRAVFIKSLIEFMTMWGFQGVDLDWEYPVEPTRGGRPIDTANFNALVQEMRAAFGSRFGISIALPADFTYIQHFDVFTLSQSVDFFNLMTYDLHGPWEADILGAIIRAPSSIPDINKALLPLWFAGIPPIKINIGASMYGRSYTLQDPGCKELGCPYSGPGNPGKCTDVPGLLSLWEIALLQQEKETAIKYTGDVGMEQIVFNGDQFVVFDASKTVDEKLKWADRLCLGGIAFWVDLNLSPCPQTLSAARRTPQPVLPAPAAPNTTSAVQRPTTAKLLMDANQLSAPASSVKPLYQEARVKAVCLEIVVLDSAGVGGRKTIVTKVQAAKGPGGIVGGDVGLQGWHS
ncbi:uncharacterized protein RCO7_05388 [Rhynchosporium graminicola]|uniref:chitinase n=1 Tax=Rhynchosporium graminicola TaxID=2792576 RepID=A0A1E1L421_9HELO|nr:uncharacterized protein RCO7_05388 [Rhynchosporium commune]